ncbi:3-oxoacyl-ACP reductase FabG [Streptomyces sp. MB09-02B]|uniref:3-oxoacyl-ACP reductase FabG n=1 Tax=Streptomyces sp. MB09-02B TaxID=3028667 RepID=UPI0029A10AA0|nr:3-oxoacyl-ACP reductase FabG [Streptomyces sp. MB09-02B]MDX3638424.1 3-oxoacyl-ACP reductase FabG [Streptomyces sp. MB09-02B]
MQRSVLVTGGSRGIGAAIAEAFLAQGDKVAVVQRSAKAPEGAYVIECDVADSRQVAAAFKEARKAHGPVEVLVNNAGISDDMLLMRMRDEQFFRVLETNLGGAFYATRCAYPDMVKKGWGRIIFVSSVVGLRGSEGQTNYAASKSAMVGLARSLAREIGRHNVTVNVVAPGLIPTTLTQGLSAERQEQILAETALQRSGTPGEVASAVTWLASGGAGFVTGAVIPVDGGLGMGH